LLASRCSAVLNSLAAFPAPGVAQIVDPFLPNYAVAAATRATPVDGALPPWLRLLVIAGHAVIALAAAALLQRRRDASPALRPSTIRARRDGPDRRLFTRK
jgi:anti-sigma-K factor RskA